AASCDVAHPNYKPVYMITSLAVTQNGSRRMAQTEVTQLSLPSLPAALTLTGTPTYGAPNSNPFRVEGDDHPNALCGNVTGPSLHAIGVTSAAADTSVSTAIPSGRRDNYTGLGGEEPNVENIASSLGALGTTSGLVELTNSIKSMATASYTGNQSGIPIGSPSVPQVTFVDGNLTLSGTQNGAGILFVTGTLSTSGNFSFKGIILVVGDGVWNSNGGGGGRVDGGVFIANIYSSTTHNSGTLLSTPSGGAVSLDWDGGGGNGIYYDSCWVKKAGGNMKYTTLSMRELPY
ncbi:MAG: hypothetical protein AB7O65_10530, partial [Candidatus Korobacteraceae bacterium]